MSAYLAAILTAVLAQQADSQIIYEDTPPADDQAGSQIVYEDAPTQDPSSSTPEPSAQTTDAIPSTSTDTSTDTPTALATEPSAPETLGETVGGVRFRAAFEGSVLALPSGPIGGGQDFFFAATPLIGIDVADEFAFELGATLRLRALDTAPEQRATDWKNVLRREDWDEASDFGQLLRELRIGRAEGGVFSLRAGPMALYTLGRGHVVNRYANVTNPDYHPLGATAQVQVGPVRTEVMASDVLARRLFAGEVSVDIGKLASANVSDHDRYHGALTYAHDLGLAGGRTSPISIVHLDLDAALHKDDRLQVFAYGGAGARLFAETPIPDPGSEESERFFGFLLGVSADAETSAMRIGGRLEGRLQGGAYRQGVFGPNYELSRFSGTGFGRGELALERLPDGYSGYAEVAVATGADPKLFPERLNLQLSASGEYFSWNRLDADVAVTATMGHTLGRLRASVVGFATGAPRYALSAEGRYRFMPSLYAIASGGTVFFPQADGSLNRGVFASIGVGADLER